MIATTDSHTGLASAKTAGFEFKHLLLPIDYSEATMAAARYGRHVAGWTDSRVTLLHVRSAGTESSDIPAEGAYILKRLQQTLGGSAAEAVTIAGDPAVEISRHAHQNGVDLIVMPTRGVGPVRRFVLGSVTAKVLQNAACPVLTFVADDKVAEEAEPHFRRIACAVDLRPDSILTMRRAAAIARRCSVPMTILYVSPQLEPAVGVVHDREWCSYLANVLRAELEKLKREAGVDGAVRLAGGEPAQRVADLTAELNADLLVIGRPRPRGILGRLRTHSYAMISQSPCPVLSV